LKLNLDKKGAYNSTFSIGGVSSSADNFVVIEILVLRINICDKNPPLRQAAKRYTQAVGTTKINLFLASLFIIFVV